MEGNQIENGRRSSSAPNEDLWLAMHEHINESKQQMDVSKLTLKFNDPVDEFSYLRLVETKYRKTWILVCILGICFSAVFQFALYIILGNSEPAKEFLMIPIVYLPLIIITSLVSCSRQEWVIVNVQFLGLAYAIFVGPVFIVAKSIIFEKFNAFVTAAFYITLLFSFTYFLRLRFIYCVALCAVALPSWFVVGAISFKKEMDQLPSGVENGFDAVFSWSAISLVCAACLISVVTYRLEWTSRLQYVIHYKLLMMNSRMRSQLQGLENFYSSRMADLDSPLEKAILGIRSLLAGSKVTATQIRVLNEVLENLNSSHLLAPNLYQQVINGQVVMDKEQQNWLFNEIARGQKEWKNNDESAISTDSNASPISGTFTSPHVLRAIQSLDDTEYDGTSESTAEKSLNINDILNPSASKILDQVNKYDFPIFELADATEQHPLTAMAHKLVIDSGLLNRLRLPKQKFVNFMVSIEAGYRSSLSFHNSIHAADVLQTASFLMKLDNIDGIFSDLEILSIYLAAAIHDYDHPGVNNNFLIATGDTRALFYNDKSVLENHHCAAAFQVLSKPQNNFLQRIEKKNYQVIRKYVVDMVLATDLALHFDLLTKFKKKVVTSGTFDPKGAVDDKNVLMQVLIKAADVSNPTKKEPIYNLWIDRITEEFYKQGDMEEKLGLPVSPFMNRARDSNSANSQKGFIEFIVYPLFEALECWAPLGEIKVNLNEHRKKYCGEVGEEKKPRPLLEIPSGGSAVNGFLASSGPIRSALSSGNTRRASIATGEFQNRRPSIVASIRQQLFGKSNTMPVRKSVDQGNYSSKGLPQLEYSDNFTETTDTDNIEKADLP